MLKNQQKSFGSIFFFEKARGAPWFFVKFWPKNFYGIFIF